MWSTVATGAGLVATALFVGSALPMLIKAARTKNLASYSGGNLLIANLGNLAQSVYLASVPPGPLWALHAFNSLASATMLTWWLRHSRSGPNTSTRHSNCRDEGAVERK